LTASDGITAVDEVGDTWDGANNRCVAINAESVHINNSPAHLEITVEFNDPTGNEPLENLLARPAMIRSSPTNITEEYSRDADNDPKAVTTVNGEPFDTLPTRIAPGRAYQIEKYVTAETKAALQAIEHTNNLGDIIIDGFVHPDNTLFMEACEFETVDSFYRVRVNILYKFGGWKDPILHAGFIQYDVANDDLTDCTVLDSEQNEVNAQRPMPLDIATGVQLDAGDALQFRDFFPYPYGDWDVVNEVLADGAGFVAFQ
jgi:hypothetical protein